MWIKELCGENFSGMNFHDTYGKTENVISGRNQSGKSTRIKAFFWLMSGYTAASQPMNSNLYDNRVELSKDTPEARVWAKVMLDNGEEYMIERIARAKFQRRRGSEVYEKSSSDEYLYKIDNIDRSASDFREWISENIVNEDLLRFCLDGSFFVNLLYEDKRKARNLIERIVGTVTRSEMQGDYSAIDELLQRFSLDEIDQRAANMAKAINDRLNEIPALIRNKEAEVSEIEQTDFVATDREIAELEAERDRLDKHITDLTERIKPQMEAKHEAERTYQMKKDVLENAYEDWKKSFEVRRQKLTDEIAAIRKQNERSERNRANDEEMRKQISADLESFKRSSERLKQKRARLVEERDKEKSVVMSESSTLCPHCGAQLQGDKLQEVVDRFERVKRERIGSIVAEGKATASEIKDIESRIKEMQERLEMPLPKVITQPTDDLEKQVLELANTNTSKIAFLETEQGKTLLDDLGSVVIPEVKMPETDEIESAKKRVNEQLVPLYEHRGLKNRLTTIRKAVDELRAEQKEKGAELAEYEKQRKAVKDFKQEQMEILSHKVNDGLKCSRISVWSKQKSGETVPDLVLKDEEGVSFSTTNTTNRIRVTADVQRFFCERLGVNLPLWLDEVAVMNKENIPHYDGVQTFLLFCSETSLKIESK